MTDAIQIISLSEGMPLHGVLPSNIIKAIRIRRDRARWDNVSFALTLSNLVLGGFSDKAQDPLKAIAPMFTEDEMAELIEEREQQERKAMEEYQLARLRRLGQ